MYGIASDLTKSKKQSKLSQTVLPRFIFPPLTKSKIVSGTLKNADINEHAITDPRCLVTNNL